MKVILRPFQIPISLFIQKKGKLDAAEEVGKAHARAEDLEKQVEKLRKDLHLKISEKDLLEARVTEAEKKVPELNAKLANVRPPSLQISMLVIWS